jgi:hypothetical protein
MVQLVDELASNLSLVKSARACAMAKHCLLLSAIASLLFLGFGGLTFAAQLAPENLSSSLWPVPQFAIADFDGDVRPDLASIEGGLNSSGDTNYWIRLQLSAGGPQSIHLVAPAGGLFIEARDVNGDHAIDLVLATAWHKQPIAVFLNDGHGRFTRTEPTRFPQALDQSHKYWRATPNHVTDAVGTPASCGKGFSKAKGLRHVLTPAALIPISCWMLKIDPCLLLESGRAPPPEILHL